MCGKDYIWNPATCTCKNGKHLQTIIRDSVIAFNEIIKVTKTFPTETTSCKNISTNLTKEKEIVKRKVSIFYLLSYQFPYHYYHYC